MTSRRTTTLIAVAVSLALVASGCGGDDDTGVEGSDTATPATESDTTDMTETSVGPDTPDTADPSTTGTTSDTLDSTTVPTAPTTAETVSPTAAAVEPNSAVVVVIAHPDDELTISPLLAHYAKADVDVYLVSVTSGQQGGGLTDIPEGDELGAARETELSAAAAAYGINEPILIRNQDGEQDSLSVAEVDELEANLRAIFEDVGAQVVITFGPDGFTGHADHIAVGAITTELVQEWQAEDDNELAPDRLYQMMFPESFSALLPAGTEFVGVPDAEATTIIDASDGIAEAEAAVLEYVTQFPEDQMTLVQALIRELSKGQVYLRWALAKQGAPEFGGTDIFG